MTRKNAIAAAAAAATLAFAASAQADENTVSYNVAPGACSKPINVPANNKAVVLAGTTITYLDRGEGQVTLLRANSGGDPLLDWAGTDYYYGYEKGFQETFTSPAVIMYLDYWGYISVETAPSLHIQVCNSSSNRYGNAIGYLTFMY
ncbi:MAG TPA: hypothetical protein VGM17_16330 [Rhizomicrobium sp.]|jgi:hypothetical protein